MDHTYFWGISIRVPDESAFGRKSMAIVFAVHGNKLIMFFTIPSLLNLISLFAFCNGLLQKQPSSF